MSATEAGSLGGCYMQWHIQEKLTLEETIGKICNSIFGAAKKGCNP